ncbi:MAG: hypothetical protein P4K94_03655 [Terracidiphilus sp.]|nr:hypothetical protein [Terracidiphilus sp.]
MSANTLYLCSIFLFSVPFLAIGVILAHYVLRRATWKHNRRLGRKRLGYYPSAFALGMAFQFFQVYYRPSVAYFLEAKREEDAEDDDEGDPETPINHLNRQLRRIRRGERIDTLVLRL